MVELRWKGYCSEIDVLNIVNFRNRSWVRVLRAALFIFIPRFR